MKFALLMVAAMMVAQCTHAWRHSGDCSPCECAIIRSEEGRMKSALCSGQDLEAIPNHLPSNLEYLDLGENRIESIDFDTISAFLHLESLNLSNNPLQTLEMNIFQNLSRLQYLDLTGCNLEDVPTAVFNNTKLRVIRGMKVDRAPFNLFEGLSQLRYVELTTDDTHLEPGLFNDLNFHDVELTLTRAESLPESIFAHESYSNSLRHVTIHAERLQSIHKDTFRALVNVQKISLYLNDMETLPSELFNSVGEATEKRRLKNIKIKGVNALPWDIFSELSYLKWLTIHDLKTPMSNNFTQDQEVLSSLDLSHNELTQLDPGWFEGLRLDLKTLNLSHNLLTELNDELSCLEEVSHINLSYNRIRKLNDQTFFNFRRALIELDLSHNDIHDVSPTLFSDMVNLRTLHLNHNHINEMPPLLFDGISGLHNLFLQYNNIDSLKQDNFTDLENIEHLDLSHNNISLLGDYTFYHLETMKILDLSYNQIEALPKDLISIGILDQIHLQGNPLHCDCGIKLLFEVKDDVHTNIQVEGECISPSQYAGRPLMSLEEHAVCPDIVSYGSTTEIAMSRERNEPQATTQTMRLTPGETTKVPQTPDAETTIAPQTTDGLIYAPQTRDGETTTTSRTTDGETTAPQTEDGETTAPQTTHVETTAPRTTDGETTAPQTRDGETTTTPRTTDNDTTAPQTTHGDTTAPQTTHGETTTAPQTTHDETTAPQTTDVKKSNVSQSTVVENTTSKVVIVTVKLPLSTHVPTRIVTEPSITESNDQISTIGSGLNTSTTTQASMHSGDGTSRSHSTESNDMPILEATSVRTIVEESEPHSGRSMSDKPLTTTPGLIKPTDEVSSAVRTSKSDSALNLMIIIVGSLCITSVIIYSVWCMCKYSSQGWLRGKSYVIKTGAVHQFI